MADEFRIGVPNEDELECVPPSGLASLSIKIRRDPRDKAAFALAQRTVGVFNSWLSANKADDRDTMSVIGAHLYSLLFVGQIDLMFREILRKRDGDATPLRVVLEFHDKAAWLAELPWEFLYLPDLPDESTGFFLCSKSNVVLTRSVHLSGRTDREPSGDGSIRILVVLSQPKDEGPVSDDLPRFLDGLGANIHVRNPVREEGQPKATRSHVKAWIGDPGFVPDIVHFIGHGQYDRTSDPRLEKGKLALIEASTGNADWCSDQDFADLFDSARPPKLVFLHACDSATTKSYRGAKGMAIALVKRGVPNVVAMQYPVENVVANRFAQSFYEALHAGKPIDEAVQAGRQALGTQLAQVLTDIARAAGQPDFNPDNYSDRRFGSPVVYVQAWKGLSVFGRLTPPAAPKDNAETTVALCPYGCANLHRRTARFCDQVAGRPLKSCEHCSELLRADAVVCTNCGMQQTGVGGRAAPPVRATVDASAAGVERWRGAAADPSPTHGSSSFVGRHDS